MPYLIVFSHIRWNCIYQRPQNLMSRLAYHYRVLFIEEPIYEQTVSRYPTLEYSCQGPNIEVLTPRTGVPTAGFNQQQASILAPLLEEYLLANCIEDYAIWFYTPMAYSFIDYLQPKAVIYDCTEIDSERDEDSMEWREMEEALVDHADTIFTSGPSLYDSKRDIHPNVHCLPNAVDMVHFSPERLLQTSHSSTDVAQLQEKIGFPRLGFFGVIDERIDFDLLAKVAEARPDWNIVMLGPIKNVNESELPKYPNIHWLGMHSYERLPYFLATWDVCFLPYIVNDLTGFINPCQTLEYMAAEKPVVSTAIPDIAAMYEDVAHFVHTPKQFIEQCETLLSHTAVERSALVSGMLTAVWRMSWDNAVESVRRELDQHLRTGQSISTAELGASLPLNSITDQTIQNSKTRIEPPVRYYVNSVPPWGLSTSPTQGSSSNRSST